MIIDLGNQTDDLNGSLVIANDSLLPLKDHPVASTTAAAPLCSST